MTAKAYSAGCLIALATLLGFTGAFNRVVDPFWYFGDVNLKGFNAARSEFTRYERHIKPILLSRREPQSVIFGSSYAEIGFDPLHPALTDHGRKTSYSFAMAGAEWEMVYCGVRYALQHAPLKTAVIGLKLVPMPAVDCNSRSDFAGPLSLTELLFSKDALTASWRTVTRQRKGPSHTAEGLYHHQRNRPDRVEARWRAEAALFRDHAGGTATGCWTDPTAAIRATLSAPPQWVAPAQPLHLEGLKEILQRLAARGVTVKLLVYPIHAEAMEMRLACGAGLERWQTLQQIAAVAEAVSQPAGGSVELWDFQGSADPLVEPIRNHQTRLWQDMGHFNVEVGNIMLDAAFGPAPRGPNLGTDVFGVRLSSAGVAERFHEFYRNRAAFLAGNSWLHDDLNRLMSGLNQDQR